MRLSMILFFGKRPIGKKYRGKNRVVKEIKPKELQMMRTDYERTEQNMLILRHPYLTVEQSKGHMAHKTSEKFLQLTEKYRNFRDERFAKHVTLAERLIHLKVKDVWE